MSRRETRTPHKYLCVVDGGHLRHSRRGFHCPRCAELAENDREYGLLVALDKYAGAAR